MTTPLPNPFTNSAATQPTARGAADRAVAPYPYGAAARFDRHFDPEKFLRDIAIGLPAMSEEGFAELMGEDEWNVPLFIGAPTEDYLKAVERDITSMLEDYVRRAG